LIADLIRAVQGSDNDDLHDVTLIAAGGVEVAACRWVLAARSSVFRRMLYGSFREAKSSSICLLGYAEPILRAIVHYCHYDTLDPSFPRSVDSIELQLQLAQAADYLQLSALQTLMEQDYILKHMAKHPGRVCTTVFNEAATGSTLANAAWHMLECRPYVTLDPQMNQDSTSSLSSGSGGGGGVTVLSAEKLEGILKSPSIGCSEWFLFCQLSNWYQHQLSLLSNGTLIITGSSSSSSTACEFTSTDSASIVTTLSKLGSTSEKNNAGTSASTNNHESLLKTTRDLLRCIRLAHIEPALLLSPAVADCPWVPQSAIFDAIAQQALSASQQGVWRLHYRGMGVVVSNNTNASATSMTKSVSDGAAAMVLSKPRVDRVLVEGAGSRDVDGMYYRIAQGCLSNDSDLYTKREVAVGQQYVYTISRCLRYMPNNNADSCLDNASSNAAPTADSTESIATTISSATTASPTMVPYYEYRIFGSKFLTHGAVQSLRTMQSTSSIVPCFQPVLQVLELTPPLIATPSSNGETNNNILANGSFDSATGGAPSFAMSASSLSVPRPIRKYYRVRLSDGDWHMPGTLAPELNALVDSGDLKERRVLQILEFGVYTIYGCAGIHVLKAVVVTTTPSYVFGDPLPLEECPDEDAGTDESTTENAVVGNGLQNLYTNKCGLDDEGSNRIPKTGWTVDSHGLSPAPECTWIPAAVGSSNVSNANNSAAATTTRSRTMPTLSGNHSNNSNNTAGGTKPNPVSAPSGNGNAPSTSPRRGAGSPRGAVRVNF
jgi:BTB/POZ domain